ncbi:MAG: 6-hydroxymethylpterin diphosphokinase MptE-like protein [Nitrospinota bacterium]
MGIFQKNIEVLDRFDHALSEKIKKLTLSEDIQFTADGMILSDSSDRDIFFRSSDTGRGVSKITDHGYLRDSEVIIICGFGLGRHITDIINSTPQSVFILVIESEIKIVRAALEVIDIEPILSCGRVSLSVGEDSISAVLNRVEDYFGVFTIRDIKVIKYPSSIKLNPSYYLEIDKRIKELRDLARFNRATLEKFTPLWQSHIFNNLISILTKPGIRGLFGKFKDKPAVIISAGPSLDKNIKWLSTAVGKIVIISVDTAVRTLVNNNISPDFIVSLDPLLENYSHLEGLENKLKNVYLVANPVTYPEIIKRYMGNILIMTYGDPLMQWFEKFIGERGETIVGGSVATSAFDFAYKLGANPIILAGQDLSFYGRRAYTGGSYYNERWIDEVCSHETLSTRHGSTVLLESEREVDDFFSGIVITSNKMLSWKRWFETMIKKIEIHCVNATEGGARIEGAVEIPLNEAIHLWCKGGIPTEDIINNYLKTVNRPDVNQIYTNMVKLSMDIKGIQKLSSDGVEISNGLMNIMNKYDSKGNHIHYYLEKMSLLAIQMLDSKEFFDINRWGIDSLLDRVNLTMRQKSGESASMIDTVKSYQIFFHGIHDICRRFSYHLDKGIQEIKMNFRHEFTHTDTKISNDQIAITK